MTYTIDICKKQKDYESKINGTCRSNNSFVGGL